MEFYKKMKQLQPLDWALLLNAVSIMFLKAVPYFLTLLLIVLIVELIRGNVAWGNTSVKILIIIGTPILLGAVGLIYTENLDKGLEECSRLLPFLIFPIVFNFYRPKNYSFFKKAALSLFALALVVRLVVNFYESIIDYQATGEMHHLFYTYFVADINIVSIFIFFAILYILEYFISNNWSGRRIVTPIILLAMLSFSMIFLQGRIVLLGFWLSLIILFWIYRKFSKKWMLLAVLGVTIGAFFIPNFNSRFSNINKNFKEQPHLQKDMEKAEGGEVQEENMIVKAMKRHSTVLMLILFGAILIVVLFFTPFHRFAPHLIVVYLILSLIGVVLSADNEDFHTEAKRLVAKQKRGELFEEGLSTSEKYRLNALLTSISLIQQRPWLGYGTGDWRDALTVEYYKRKLKQNFIEQTAPHNQYFRTWLRHGIFGFLAFLAYLFWLVKGTVNHSMTGRYAFVLCIVLSAVGYDIFDVGGSIPFIAYFSCLFFIIPPSHINENQKLQ